MRPFLRRVLLLVSQVGTVAGRRHLRSSAGCPQGLPAPAPTPCPFFSLEGFWWSAAPGSEVQ